MKILILGASGFTGSFLKNFFFKNGNEVYGTFYTKKETRNHDNSMMHFDVEQPGTILDILKEVVPDVVVNCLRGDFQKQLQVQENLIHYYQNHSGRIVFFSSSNAFDKDLSKPHVETDVAQAESDYGMHKIECEKLLMESLPKCSIILRPSFILGKGCRRTTNLLDCVEHNQPFQTYENVFFNYTPILQIAEWLTFILEENLTGIFHVGTKDCCDYTKFIQKLLEQLSLQEPPYEVEKVDEKLYQAVLPTRKEIPDKMQWTIVETIDYLKTELKREIPE